MKTYTTDANFVRSHLNEDELKGFLAYCTDARPDATNAACMEGWTIAWGFTDAQGGQPNLFPHDPDYAKGYAIGLQFLESLRRPS